MPRSVKPPYKRKGKMFTVWLSDQEMADFRVAAKLLGETMAALVKPHIEKIISQGKARSPEAFKTKTKLK